MSFNKTNQSSAPRGQSTFHYTQDWYWTLRWIMALLIIIGNLIIIIVILTRKRLRKVIPNMFIVSLAVADFVVGAFIVPASYHCTFHVVCDWLILLSLFNFLLYCSICNLCVMTLDRFIAVVCPYSYEMFMTRRKAWLLIATAWIVPMFVCLVPFAWKNEDPSMRASYQKTYSFCILLLIEFTPCVLMIITHIPIYLVVRKHSRQIACQSVPQVNSQTRSKTKNERSTVKVFTLVVFLFIFCYCVSLYRGACRYFGTCKPSVEVTLFSRLLLLGNSFMNPIVYLFMKRDIRRVIKSIAINSLRMFGFDNNLNSEESSVGSTNNDISRNDEL